MSVLIKGMEMPTSCYYCPFADGSWGYSPPHKKRCLISGKDMPVDERNVQHDPLVCPLVEIPPHGRLIDANVLMENEENISFKDEWHMTVTEAFVSVKNIAHAPTIIEAEEGE